jgi:hypothetical protein
MIGSISRVTERECLRLAEARVGLESVESLDGQPGLQGKAGWNALAVHLRDGWKFGLDVRIPLLVAVS